MTVDKQSVDGTVERGQGEVLNSGGLLGESAVGTQARRRVLVEQLHQAVVEGMSPPRSVRIAVVRHIWIECMKSVVHFEM